MGMVSPTNERKFILNYCEKIDIYNQVSIVEVEMFQLICTYFDFEVLKIIRTTFSIKVSEFINYSRIRGFEFIVA